MDLHHTFSVPVRIDAAWEAFTDIQRIAPCLPGAVITGVDGDDFTGTARVKLGPISLQYAGEGTWVLRDRDSYRAVIKAQGRDRRGNGTAGATISARLEPDAHGTRVIVDTELKITGRPAQFGRGVIQDVGTKLLDQFAACLASRLAEPEAQADTPPRHEPGPATVSGESPPPVVGEGVPPDRGPASDDAARISGAHTGLTGAQLIPMVGPALLKRSAPYVLVAVIAFIIGRARRRCADR